MSGALPRVALTLVLLVGSVGCRYDPFAHEFATVKPDAEDLVGPYELDGTSIEMLRKERVEPPPSRFVVHRDGTFAAIKVPACWREAFECSSKTESANGTWQVVKDSQGWWVVRLHVLRIDDFAANYGMDAHVRGDRPRLLHFTVGDPDEGKALVFQRFQAPN